MTHKIADAKKVRFPNNELMNIARNPTGAKCRGFLGEILLRVRAALAFHHDPWVTRPVPSETPAARLRAEPPLRQHSRLNRSVAGVPSRFRRRNHATRRPASVAPSAGGVLTRLKDAREALASRTAPAPWPSMRRSSLSPAIVRMSW